MAGKRTSVRNMPRKQQAAAMASIRAQHDNRSQRARAADARQTARQTFDADSDRLPAWQRQPGRYDVEGVDTKATAAPAKPEAMKQPASGWKVLARHKWVAGAVVTESHSEEKSTSKKAYRRYTATIRGYRNWKIYEGFASDIETQEIVDKVRSIRDRIDAGDKAVFNESGSINKPEPKPEKKPRKKQLSTAEFPALMKESPKFESRRAFTKAVNKAWNEGDLIEVGSKRGVAFGDMLLTIDVMDKLQTGSKYNRLLKYSGDKPKSPTKTITSNLPDGYEIRKWSYTDNTGKHNAHAVLFNGKPIFGQNKTFPTLTAARKATKEHASNERSRERNAADRKQFEEKGYIGKPLKKTRKTKKGSDVIGARPTGIVRNHLHKLWGQVHGDEQIGDFDTWLSEQADKTYPEAKADLLKRGARREKEMTKGEQARHDREQATHVNNQMAAACDHHIDKCYGEDDLDNCKIACTQCGDDESCKVVKHEKRTFEKSLADVTDKTSNEALQRNVTLLTERLESGDLSKQDRFGMNMALKLTKREIADRKKRKTAIPAGMVAQKSLTGTGGQMRFKSGEGKKNTKKIGTKNPKKKEKKGSGKLTTFGVKMPGMPTIEDFGE